MSQLTGILRKIQRVQPAAMRHILARNTHPYERILQHLCPQKDLWITTQGDYMQWWHERESLAFSIRVLDGRCDARVSSPRAVIEQVPGKFLDTEGSNSASVACPQATFTGECYITIASDLQHQETLIEILRREGILNYRIANEGEFLLTSTELDPLLERAYAKLQTRQDQLDPEDVRAVREIVIQKLANHNLPLLRVWYHPRVDGVVKKAVFSPRYDVDRAITNMAGIRRLEQKYGVESTFYIRSFCPFYTDEAVEQLSAMPWCPEIALHGEFVTNARTYGDEINAAIAEKIHLEKITRTPIRGVGMHGGELTSNRSEFTNEAIRKASILYDTTPRPAPGNYLPFRKLVDGKYSDLFGLPHALSDVNIEADRHYGQVFYDETIKMMRQIYAENGVFVLMMHPEYFGFFSYLSRPANLLALIRFMSGYLAGERRVEAETGRVVAS